MIDFQTLDFESVRLQNRLGRLVDVDVCCVSLGQRYAVILRAAEGAPAILVSKNAEHFAYQLREKLEVDAEKIDFLQVNQGDESRWLRWRFQWAGKTPLKAHCEPMSEKARKNFIWTQLNSDEVDFHRLNAVAAVA